MFRCICFNWLLETKYSPQMDVFILGLIFISNRPMSIVMSILNLKRKLKIGLFGDRPKSRASLDGI